MSNKRIEDTINNVLKDDSKKNALDLVAYLRENETSDNFSINMHDEKDESGWNISNLGFIIITGSDDFPGPWTMWVGADKIGENSTDEQIREFAWSYVSPCGSCGGNCTPGIKARIFGKDFENTCQSNLMFNNPNAEAVASIIKILDIKKNEILRGGI